MATHCRSKWNVYGNSFFFSGGVFTSVLHAQPHDSEYVLVVSTRCFHTSASLPSFTPLRGRFLFRTGDTQTESTLRLTWTRRRAGSFHTSGSRQPVSGWSRRLVAVSLYTFFSLKSSWVVYERVKAGTINLSEHHERLSVLNNEVKGHRINSVSLIYSNRDVLIFKVIQTHRSEIVSSLFRILPSSGKRQRTTAERRQRRQRRLRGIEFDDVCFVSVLFALFSQRVGSCQTRPRLSHKTSSGTERRNPDSPNVWINPVLCLLGATSDKCVRPERCSTRPACILFFSVFLLSVHWCYYH